MAAEQTPLASNIVAGMELATGDWGSGTATVLGANDGVALTQLDIALNQPLVASEAWTGTIDPAAAVPGPRTPGATIGMELGFEGASLRPLVALQGAEAVSSPASGVYLHEFPAASSHEGVNLTFAARMPGSGLYVAQYRHAKVTEGTFTFEQGAAFSMASYVLTAHDEDLNGGAVDDDLIVVSVPLANGPLTIAAQPPVPQPLSVTITGGPPTEAIITIDYVDPWGKATTHVHQFTVDGLTSASAAHAREVVAVTVSGLSGSGGVKVGVTDGIGNTITTMGAVTRVDATRVLFRGVRVWMAPQSKAGNFDAADLLNAEKLEIKRTLAPNTRITFEFGDRQSEPTTAGAGSAETTVSLTFGALTDQNAIQYHRRRAMQPCRMLVEAMGDFIGVTGYRRRLRFWLQGLQISEGEPKPSGRGVIPLDVTMMGSVVAATPTGWPSGVTGAFHVDLMNGTSGKVLLP